MKFKFCQMLRKNLQISLSNSSKYCQNVHKFHQFKMWPKLPPCFVNVVKSSIFKTIAFAGLCPVSIAHFGTCLFRAQPSVQHIRKRTCTLGIPKIQHRHQDDGRCQGLEVLAIREKAFQVRGEKKNRSPGLS